MQIIFGRITFVLIALFRWTTHFAEDKKPHDNELKGVRGIYHSSTLLYNKQRLFAISRLFAIDLVFHDSNTRGVFSEFFLQSLLKKLLEMLFKSLNE